jgi:hypothetical protein
VKKRLHELQIGVMMGGHDCMTDQWPVAHIPMVSSSSSCVCVCACVGIFSPSLSLPIISL